MCVYVCICMYVCVLGTRGHCPQIGSGCGGVWDKDWIRSPGPGPRRPACCVLPLPVEGRGLPLLTRGTSLFESSYDGDMVALWAAAAVLAAVLPAARPAALNPRPHRQTPADSEGGGEGGNHVFGDVYAYQPLVPYYASTPHPCPQIAPAQVDLDQVCAGSGGP